MKYSLFAFAALAAVPMSVFAEPSVGVLGNGDKVVVDGRLDEPCWAKADGRSPKIPAARSPSWRR